MKRTKIENDSPPGKFRLWKVAFLAGALGLGTWLVLSVLVPQRLPDDFPALPDPPPQNAALRALLNDANTKAREHPNSAEDIGRLGMIYHANQYYDQARRAYGIASRLESDDYRWPYCLALVEEESGRDAEEYDLLKSAVKNRPDYYPALQKLADIYYKRDNLDEAARYYQLALRSGGKDCELQALFGLGRIAVRRQDWTKAVESAAPLARGYPYVRTPHQLLVEAYDALGQKEKADEERRALLEPTMIVIPLIKDPLGKELLGLSCSATRLLKEAGLFSRFRQPDDAIQVARRAVEVEPGDADAHHFLARTLLEAHGGDSEAVTEALGQLNQGLRLRTDDPLPLWYFATIFFTQKKTDAAVDQLRTMLAGHSAKPESHYYLGLVADHQGRAQEAAAHYRDALKADPGNAEAYHKLGLISVKEGKLDEATSCFKKAVQLKPGFDMARCNLGVALDMQGKTGQAIEQFEAALRLKPNDATTHKYLAIAFAKTGKLSQAIQHLREAVRLVPADEEARIQLQALERSGQ